MPDKHDEWNFFRGLWWGFVVVLPFWLAIYLLVRG